MKLNLATAHQILLELSEADLMRFGLSVERLLLPTGQTREQLNRLLSALAEETGQAFQLSRNSGIDVLPDLAGGCLLIVSDCEQKGQVVPPCVFFAQEINALIDAARSVCRTGKNSARVTLLGVNDGFLLFPGLTTKSAFCLLSEYLEPVYLSSAACAVLREHGRVLLEDAPFSALCGCT